MTPDNQSHKYYFDHPEIWEEINRGRFIDEPAFLLDIFKKYYRGQVREILDVGCGTGFHLSGLNEFGLTGIGVDLNAEMIRFASERNPSLKFEVKDMRCLDYSNQFDGVLCLCTTFSYNRTNSEIIASLSGFAEALKEGGIVVIDVLNAIGLIQKRKFQDRIEETYEKLGLRSETANTIDECEQILEEKRTFFSMTEDKQVKTDTTVFRLFFPQEVRFFLETTGFDLLGFYGGYNLTHATLDGPRMIVVAQKNSNLKARRKCFP